MPCGRAKHIKACWVVVEGLTKIVAMVTLVMVTVGIGAVQCYVSLAFAQIKYIYIYALICIYITSPA